MKDGKAMHLPNLVHLNRAEAIYVDADGKPRPLEMS